MAVLGLDLGGTKLSAALFNTEGIIVHRDVELLQGRKGHQVGMLLEHNIKKYLKIADSSEFTINAIGISIPGIYYQKTGCVWAPNIEGWENYPLLKEIKDLPELKNIKVKIDSDRACYILGESWQGAAQRCKNAIFLAVGTGIGAGILVDGSILRGHGDIAGAVGWMGLTEHFNDQYRLCGCFEYHASGNGITKKTQDLVRNNREYVGILKQIQIDKIRTQDIFAAYKNGDTIARQVLDDAVRYWGMAVANLVSIFNPEIIIFGGGIFGPAAQFLERIKDESKKWAQPISIDQVHITVSVMAGDAGLYGSGKLALQALLK
jgi:glucokinase